ncbi:MAG: PepSY-like domain-containing protein [Chitinophagaceae bacterium]
MVKRIAALFIILFFVGGLAQAQIREIPPAVKEAFENQYAKAEQVSYNDIFTSVQVRFEMNGEKYIAKYTNKGAWKETEKEWNLDKLEQEVKDGFQKSKYAEWKQTEVAVVYLPGGSEQYRIKVEKNDVVKRYLFFNKSGRLIRDAITL